MPTRFKKFLGVSAAVHFLAFLFILFSPAFSHLFPSRQTKITWIQLSKGTGEKPSDSSFKKAKGLPASTIREQKEALNEKAKDLTGKDIHSQESANKQKPEDQESQKKQAENGGIQFNEKKSEADRTIEEALARNEEEMKKRQVDIEAAQIEKEGVGQSPQGSLDAKTSETDPALVAYYEAVKKKINDEWITTPKETTGDQALKTQIVVQIDGQGNMISAEYQTKSGDDAFDLSTMRAIQRAAPFPPPPDTIRAEALSEGFLIEFNPKNGVNSL